MTLPMAGLILLVIYSLTNPENLIEAVPQRDVDSKTCPNLYEPGDKIQLLSNNNFNENIYNSTTASMVQFYKTCHSECEKAAPIWKHLAFSIYNWRDVVQMKAINCGDNQNTQLCQEYGITEYPTVRYFPPLLKSYNAGKLVLMNVRDFVELRAEIIKHLQNTETKLLNWPNFSSVDSSNVNMIRESNNHRTMILVVETLDSYLGRQLVLDLHPLKNVIVRYTFDQKLSNTKERLPQVFVMKSTDAPKQLPLPFASRYEVLKLVQDYLRKDGQEIPEMRNVAEDEFIHNTNFSEDDKNLMEAYMLFINSLSKPYQN